MIHDVAIVGAGLSGLSAARHLADNGLRVVVLEKSRGVGGRAATRRLESGNGAIRVDHGAQFFTVRDPLFQKQFEEWSARGICAEWAQGFHSSDSGGFRPPAPEWDSPRYACPQGISALGKELARELDVRLGCKATSVCLGRDGWTLRATEPSDEIRARSLFCSAPLPQSLDLVGEHLPPQERVTLERIGYEPCLAVMALYKGMPAPDWRGVKVRDESSPLAWVACDSSRRGTSFHASETVVLVFHAKPEFTRAHGELPERREAAAIAMLAAATPFAGSWVARPSQKQVHFWRYATPIGPLPERCFFSAGADFPLYLVGDAFGGGRIQGAWMSGRRAADDLLRMQGGAVTSPD